MSSPLKGIFFVEEVIQFLLVNWTESAPSFPESEETTKKTFLAENGRINLSLPFTDSIYSWSINQFH